MALLLYTLGTCAQQPIGLLVCITHTAVACLSGVIASLFMVACRQQRLISGLNGAACDSGNKRLCSVSLYLALGEGNRGTREREDCSAGPQGGNSSYSSEPPWRLKLVSKPGVISQIGLGSRVIYSLW